MITVISIVCSTHVPTYGNCVENCCTPALIHTTSQVIYLKGRGGLEVHLKSDTEPFDILNNEIIDVDVVFKDPIDQTTYDIFIGCGGCVLSEDGWPDFESITLNGYEEIDIEPFTQTSYSSIFQVKDRKFNTSGISNCSKTNKHFSIQLRDYENRTNDQEIIWGAVIGLEEKFTFKQLLEFPIYILKNHGDTWNQLGYTYWLWVTIGSPIMVFIFIRVVIVRRYKLTYSIREALYIIALIGFVSAGFEELTHLLYVQVGKSVKWGFWVGLFVVILFSQGIGFLLTLLSWLSFLNKDKKWKISHPCWAPFESLAGFSLMFLFGSGFFLGPGCLMLAGIIRLKECGNAKKNDTTGNSIELKNINLDNRYSNSLGYKR